tara:strand:+ start:170 stop:1363 length:1194 start_codon:yes stop_codon:yes gene_type:complete
MNKIYETCDIKTVDDVKSVVKALTKDMLQRTLESEIDDTLGYSKHDIANKEYSNSRNGYYPKSVRTESGNIDLKIPRDREGQHEPVIVKKHESSMSGIEEKIIAMSARGNSTRDIGELMQEMYGINVSAEMVSKITDKMIPQIREWQSRPLSSVYPILYLDALNLNIRQDGKTLKKAVYLALGIDPDGMKDVLGIWIGGNESSKFWLGILTELKNRGVQDICIACVDGLKGFSEAIESIYPKTQVQRCIVHQIRYSCKYVNYKDRKEFCADMKAIYSAPTEESGLEALTFLDDKWGKKYAYAIKSWEQNWTQLATFFAFPDEVRKIIYTTNAIESLNSCVKKITQPKRLFPSDDSALKSVFFAIQNRLKKWTSRQRDWASILSQFQIHFPGRLEVLN